MNCTIMVYHPSILKMDRVSRLFDLTGLIIIPPLTSSGCLCSGKQTAGTVCRVTVQPVCHGSVCQRY